MHVLILLKERPNSEQLTALKITCMAFTGTKTGYVEPLRRRGGHGTDQPDVESQPD